MSTALYLLKQHDHLGPGWLLDRCDPTERPFRMVTVTTPDSLPMAIECNGVVLVGRTLDPEAVTRKDPLVRAQVVFVRTLIALGVPYLGIDRGAQLLARAMLADLAESPTEELGYAALPLTAAGRADALLGTDTGELRAVRWPTHRCALPRKATLLAGTDDAVEAFRFGDNAWGLLPHLELTPPAFEGWLGEPDAPSLDAARRTALLDEVKEHLADQRDAAYDLMDRFLERSRTFRHVAPPLADLHPGPENH